MSGLVMGLFDWDFGDDKVKFVLFNGDGVVDRI